MELRLKWMQRIWLWGITPAAILVWQVSATNHLWTAIKSATWILIALLAAPSSLIWIFLSFFVVLPIPNSRIEEFVKYGVEFGTVFLGYFQWFVLVPILAPASKERRARWFWWIWLFLVVNVIIFFVGLALQDKFHKKEEEDEAFLTRARQEAAFIK